MKGSKSPLLPDFIAGIRQFKRTFKTRREAKEFLKDGKGTFIRERIEIHHEKEDVK